ncbi:uncharacterized protein LOC114351334 isoform X2 [Ostrinia furnacalis]|uniref:uncharacterized protein LOC114351334 isoform X2 n=1 Tax=Ostrinia furnacalis TaxID=93504 RepID=UPI00103AB6D7|nr:uncharacterized protein LOC114351334 isoform X2 [Ostrinia furnacalis]
MSKNNLPSKSKQQRFKGVENFLRRVAFNLGNSPSQTEVKIISCIPIDVTDLQQKIINLEKQLDEAKANTRASSDASPAPHVAVCRAHLPRACAEPRAPCELCSPRHSRSPACHPPQPVLTASPKPTADHQCACHSTDASADENKSKGLFGKSKKKKAKKKDKALKTQFVYYAQTTTGPFNDYLGTVADESPTREREAISRTYLTEMIRKQYAPAPVPRELSLGDRSSQFSSPVCRDADSRPAAPDSDLCSCCRGACHNIDRHVATHRYTDVLNTYPACSVNNAGFYDSSLYDMVPVREKPARSASPRYDYEIPKKKVAKINARYRPEKITQKTRFQPLVINHYARVAPVAGCPKRTPMAIYSKMEKKARRVPPKRNELKVDRLRQTETSNSCCIDCGDVYMKRLNASNKIQEPIKPNKPASCKNAECLTNILNDTECQTTTTQSVQIDQALLEEKKTEQTLNQIKSILQSVLTEVKTNTQLKKTSEIKDKSTKDAVVQKGSSQGNVPGCSSLLHSFTYSPYNMNPYVASCSRQMTSGPCCYPNFPCPSAKCMQNFPVFIQTPGRHMCAGCYRNSSHVPKMPKPKPAATAATNTDSKERSKETEKLIKEIYKSMAVNMDFPAKDTSASEYNDLKSTPRVSVNKSLYRPSVLDEGMRKFMKTNGSRNLQKSATPITTMNSRLMSNTLSMRSQIVSTTDTERRLRNSRIENYLENIDAHENRQNKIEEEREYEEQSPETTASDDEASYSEASVHDTYVQAAEPVKKPDKKGLFSKMFKSVKLFNGKSKNKQKVEEQVQVSPTDDVDDESDGNSDDYQTIYSQRVERRPRYVPHVVRSPYRLKAHSKISYSRHMRDRNQERKRPPYMEQEYRRHWNEKLMFHENRHRYSSDSPYSKDTPRHTRNPAYWQNYEARSALVNNTQMITPRAPEPNVRTPITREDILRSVNDASINIPKANAATKGLAWLKRHKLGIRCGDQWKKFILES